MAAQDTGEPLRPQEPVVSVRGLQQVYGATQVLAGVDLEVHRGEVVCLLGPNGAGKTTTIEILEGFRIPSAGRVRVLGEDPATAGDAWKARVGIVLQSWRDHARWSPRRLLGYLAGFYAPYADADRPPAWDVDELLGVVGLTAHADSKILTLSGGQRRRLDVAVGIVGRPELLFLDEPTTGFDPQARLDFHDLVHRLTDLEGTTILLTTHDLAEAERLADRILVLAAGRIVADGSPEALVRQVSGEAQVRWTRGGEHFVHASAEPVAFVRALLDEPGAPVTDLEVRRASLEDTYVTLVHQMEHGSPDEAADRFLEVVR